MLSLRLPVCPFSLLQQQLVIKEHVSIKDCNFYFIYMFFLIFGGNDVVSVSIYFSLISFTKKKTLQFCQKGGSLKHFSVISFENEDGRASL